MICMDDFQDVNWVGNDGQLIRLNEKVVELMSITIPEKIRVYEGLPDKFDFADLVFNNGPVTPKHHRRTFVAQDRKRTTSFDDYE